MKKFAPTICFYLGFSLAFAALSGGSTRILAFSVLLLFGAVADINDRGWKVEDHVRRNSATSVDEAEAQP